MTVSTGCSSIDSLLDGGIESGIITEVYGGGGTGKTNLCLQVTKNIALQDKRIAYLDTEGVSMERLKQIAGDKYDKVMKNILIFRAHSFDEQEERLDNIIGLTEKKDMEIALIIVDSLTIFYRTLLDDDQRQKTTSRLGRILIDLIKVSRKEDIPVLVTSQVYEGSDSVESLGGHILYHNAKTIIMLENLGKHLRRCTLIKHRHLPERSSVEFKITDKGLVSV